MWTRFLLSVLLMMMLMSFPGERPATAATARQGVVYELGPDVYSTLARSFGYQWYAAGYVFPAGMHDGLGQCDRPDAQQAIGTYAIYGTTGKHALHQAIYRVSIKGESYYFQGEIPALDENGKAATSLFRLTLKVNGQFIEEDPSSEATYTPRSTSCFGGSLMLFKGAPVPAETPQFQEGTQMAKLSVLQPQEEGREEYVFHCPACAEAHWIRVKGPEPVWQWNGNPDAPTFSPSVRVRKGDERVCHSMITDGKMTFFNDSTHALAGQKNIPIPECQAKNPEITSQC